MLERAPNLLCCHPRPRRRVRISENTLSLEETRLYDWAIFYGTKTPRFILSISKPAAGMCLGVPWLNERLWRLPDAPHSASGLQLSVGFVQRAKGLCPKGCLIRWLLLVNKPHALPAGKQRKEAAVMLRLARFKRRVHALSAGWALSERKDNRRGRD